MPQSTYGGLVNETPDIMTVDQQAPKGKQWTF